MNEEMKNGQMPENTPAPEDIENDMQPVMPEESEPEQPQQPELSPEEKKLQKSRKWRYGSVATVMTVLVIVGVVVLNLIVGKLADVYPMTFDLTADKTFTLSEQSAELAGKITENVEIVVFADEASFASPSYDSEEFNTIATQLYTALQQYKSLSGGKVSYQFVDLTSNPTMTAHYQNYNVSQGDILMLCGDNYQKVSINDMYSATTNYQTYSYEYTSEVEKVLATKLNVVCGGETAIAAVLTGHAEESAALSGVQTVLGNNGCDVRTLDITTAEEPAAETVIFVVPAPTTDYTVEEVTRLRDWLDNGGKRGRHLIVFTSYRADCPNLFALLNDNYGIEVDSNIVIETSSSNYASMRAYNTYGDIAATDYTNDLTSGRVMSPITRRLLTHFENNSENGTYSVPFVTFGDTAKLETLAIARGEEAAPEDANDALYAADSYPITGAAYTVSRVYDNDAQQMYKTGVMVFGSSDFLNSDILTNLSSALNEEVFISVFSGVCGIENLIDVSSRPLTQETLDFSNSLTPMLLGIVVFTIGLPLLTLSIALGVFLRRRRL